MIARIKSIFKDDTINNAVIVMVGTQIASVFGYLLHIILGNLISIEAYGYFNAALSLTTLLTFFSAGLSIAIVKVVSDLVGAGKKDDIASLFWLLIKVFLIIGLAVFIILSLFRNSFSVIFNIPFPVYFIFFGVYLIARYLMVVPTAFMQGMLMFKQFSIYIAVSSILRTIIVSILAYFGYSVGQMYLGMGLTEFALLTALFFIIHKKFNNKKKVQVKKHIKAILDVSLPVLAIYFGLLFFNNIDVIMVKKFFSATDTGLYVGVVTIGKIILFASSSISVVMFPKISALKSEKKSFKSNFNKLFLFQVLLVGSLSLIFATFPKFITLTIFGERFIESAKYLPLYALFAACYVLIGFLSKFLLAVDNNIISILILIAVTLQLGLLNIFHATLFQVLYVNLVALIFLLITLYFYSIREINNN